MSLNQSNYENHQGGGGGGEPVVMLKDYFMRKKAHIANRIDKKT